MPRYPANGPAPESRVIAGVACDAGRLAAAVAALQGAGNPKANGKHHSAATAGPATILSFETPAPAVASEPPPDAWLKAAVDKCVKEVEEEPPGNRNNKLNTV